MAKPVNFKAVDLEDREKALELVSFPVERKQVCYVDENQKIIPINREVIYRKDTGYQFEVLSPDYQIVKHEVALQATFQGLDKVGIPYNLKSVGLDRDGAKMLARFQFDKLYPIIKGVDQANGLDVLKPELTLVNSYDGCIALGFDLGSQRLVCLNLATAVIPDFKARWMHIGTSADPQRLLVAAREALEQFEKVVVPKYRQMAETEISKDLVVKGVIRAIQKDILPKKLAKFAIKCANDDSALEKEKHLKRSLWTFFNTLTWTTTHKFEGSPTRKRELQQNIAKAFKDNGKKLLQEAEELDETDVAEWMEKVEQAE